MWLKPRELMQLEGFCVQALTQESWGCASSRCHRLPETELGFHVAGSWGL